MNKLLIGLLVLSMSCTTAVSQTDQSSKKSEQMQKKAEILVSESQGGADQPGFSIIKNEQELQKAVKGGNSNLIVEAGTEPVINYPKFPKDKKVVLYNLGMFRSGDHRISEIKKRNPYKSRSCAFCLVPTMRLELIRPRVTTPSR